MRFSPFWVSILMSAACVIYMIYLPVQLLVLKDVGPYADIVVTVFYIAFVVIPIREQLGKLIFTILVLMDMGNLTLVSAKFLEGLLFSRETAMLKYHFTFSLCAIPVLLIEIPVVWYLVFKDLASEEGADRTELHSVMWRWLWLIPGVFYMFWVEHFYRSGKSALENALDPVSTGYLVLIDAGSVLIYRMIIRLVELQRKQQRLEAENHMLAVQKLQFEHLRARVMETRKARHDLRHHILLLQKIRDNKDFDALDEVLADYPALSRLEQPLSLCENETADMILGYYASQAESADIRFEARVALPEKLFVESTKLAVLLGNLLENAYEAALRCEGERFIRVHASLNDLDSSDKHLLSICVENSYITEPELKNGHYQSSKHEGEGIGIESVKSIAAIYSGICTFTRIQGVFSASVLLYE